MALSGNKGEWSEIYVLLKLLADGKLYAGDECLNKLEEIFYPILKVIREDDNKYEYVPKDSQIIVFDENGDERVQIPLNKIEEYSKLLLEKIKTSVNTFSVHEIDVFLSDMGCAKLKVSSKNKADIHVVIHDLRTNQTPLLGFSVKSQLGQPSTLLNAGKTTNITYKLVGRNIDDGEINRINALKSVCERLDECGKSNLKLEFFDVDNDVFRNNLLLLDLGMPQLIADVLRIYYTSKYSSVKECVERLSKENPFDYNGNDVNAFYSYKIKVLLLSVALGMMPATEWKGKYDANGGYIVVKVDGDIVCYHFYNRNDVENYLYNNTKFEKASRTRHDYGSLYRGSDGHVYIKLNLQIRFIK